MRFVGIDPATKTGVAILNEHGEVLFEKELKGEGKAEKGGITIPQLVDLENQLYKILLPGDEVMIEQAAAGTQKGITTGMIHGGLRGMICRKGLSFNEINPQWTKKYVSVTGWTLENGKNRRLTTTESKKEIKSAVLEQFGYTHKSDNVIDAYIIARSALNLYLLREYKPLIDNWPLQIEVTQAILAKTE